MDNTQTPVIENRAIGQEPTAAAESRRIEGYALVFNTDSTGLSRFTESIDPGALEGVIERSDVLCVLDHDPRRGVLARSRHGSGTLTLAIDSTGLRYSFDAPATALGDEVLEGVRRGDIGGSSFRFTVERDRWERRGDGTPHRTILRIGRLYDVSPVYSPAYDAATVHADVRGLDALLQQEQRQAEEQDETQSAAAQDSDEARSEESENDSTPEITNEIRHSTMHFSLLRTINNVVNGAPLDEAAQAIDARGRAAMSANGQRPVGQLVLPVESRAEGDGGSQPSTTPPAGILATVATQGQENVATDTLNIVEPLRAAMVTAAAGATVLTGLCGDIAIPIYSGSNVGWKGEAVTADRSEGAFSEKTMSPKRLTGFIDISKQFLVQDSNDAEEMIRRDIINAMAEKLEKTILGSGAGSDTQPAGLFNGVTADTAAFKAGDVIDMEATLENANVSGMLTYVANPATKAIMRKTSRDTGSGRFVMEAGEVEGIKVLSTSAVVTRGLILGDFRELIIGQWGGIDLTIDPFTRATDGMVRIIINAYFDAIVRRPSAFVKKVLKA